MGLTRPRLPITAPTGRKATAQGSALGEQRERGASPERGHKDVVHEAAGAVWFRPFRACEFLGTRHSGRRCALPWAVPSRPFRPEAGRVHSSFLRRFSRFRSLAGSDFQGEKFEPHAGSCPGGCAREGQRPIDGTPNPIWTIPARGYSLACGKTDAP